MPATNVKSAYRTAAVVPVEAAPLVVKRPNEKRRRGLLVAGVWAPLHLTLTVACGMTLWPGMVFPALLAWLLGVGCAVHACVMRSYPEPEAYPLTALVVLTPRACRLGWALALVVPAIGPLVYLLSHLRVPESTSSDPHSLDVDLMNADKVGPHHNE